MYIMKIMFEYSEIYTCIWSVNQEAEDKYGGYIVMLDRLPLSNNLSSKLKRLCEEYQSSLNWDDPPAPSPWTEEHKADFLRKATEAYEQLRRELGSDFKVINRIVIP